MAEKITSAQVAALAGVSQSAVSRVFTPGASASKKTAEKVREAAHNLGYRPNVLARAMVSGRSRIIGLVVAYLENQFYPEAIEILSAALQGQGYHILVFTAPQGIQDVDNVLDEILAYQVDGIILASVGMSHELATRCRDMRVPVLLFNRRQDDDRLSAVTSDNLTGGRKIANHLVETGHRRISYIAGWEGASTQRDREAGFRAGLADHDVELFSRECGDFSYNKAVDATRRLFDRTERPDAVFVANDHMAFAVLDTLRYELGLKVPDDVSVVGFDDVKLAAWPAFNLTTVRQPARRMAERAVTILLEQIDRDDAKPHRVALEGPLILRGTTRDRKRKEA